MNKTPVGILLNSTRIIREFISIARRARRLIIRKARKLQINKVKIPLNQMLSSFFRYFVEHCFYRAIRFPFENDKTSVRIPRLGRLVQGFCSGVYLPNYTVHGRSRLYTLQLHYSEKNIPLNASNLLSTSLAKKKVETSISCGRNNQKS